MSPCTRHLTSLYNVWRRKQLTKSGKRVLRVLTNRSTSCWSVRPFSSLTAAPHTVDRRTNGPAVSEGCAGNVYAYVYIRYVYANLIRPYMQVVSTHTHKCICMLSNLKHEMSVSCGCPGIPHSTPTHSPSLWHHRTLETVPFGAQSYWRVQRSEECSSCAARRDSGTEQWPTEYMHTYMYVCM